jgi:hypothetical protein
MRKGKVALEIKQPCGEPWAGMTRSGHGRYCMNCQKSVIDFTGMNDRQILAIIVQANGKVCGRLNKDQLARPLDLGGAEQRSPVPMAPLLAGLMLLGGAENLMAQANNEPITSVHVLGEESDKTTISGAKKLCKALTGRVVDKDSKLPLSGVLIQHYYRGRYNTLSDEDGYFSLELPEKLSKQSNWFKITKTGYVLLEFQFEKGVLPLELQGSLEMESMDNLGLRVAGEIEVRPHK